jgi:hypothetical protein
MGRPSVAIVTKNLLRRGNRLLGIFARSVDLILNLNLSPQAVPATLALLELCDLAKVEPPAGPLELFLLVVDFLSKPSMISMCSMFHNCVQK